MKDMNGKLNNICIMKIEKLISEIDEIQYSDKRCCYGTCSNPPIRSHTISENFLYKLSNDLTNVITFEPAMSLIVNKQNPKLVRNVNKKRFSTFTGFCSIHDVKLFKPIDLFDGQINNEIAMLIHYKNICYGINHIKTQQLRLCHMSAQNYVQDKLSDTNGDKIIMSFKNNSLSLRLDYCLSQYLLRKQQLEHMIESREFNRIKFHVLHGCLNNPIFCGRSSYLLHKNHGLFKTSGYSYMPWITYMTLLTNNLVFCWLKNDEAYAKRLNILLKNEDSKKIIEVLAYACSDAFAVEKNFYRKNVSPTNRRVGQPTILQLSS